MDEKKKDGRNEEPCLTCADRMRCGAALHYQGKTRSDRVVA